MKHDMNPIVQYSPFGGTLIREEVRGMTSGMINPENNVDTALGRDRTMYTYVPASGCFHAKQCPVLYVLRNDNTYESAQKLLKDLKLDRLAEENHMIVLFPDPLEDGWNDTCDPEKEDDCAFLVRCFAALPASKGKTAGFNGMMYYIGESGKASSMIMSLAERSPMDAAALMIGSFPETYHVPEKLKAAQCAWIYEKNDEAADLFRKACAPAACREKDGIAEYVNVHNSCIRFIVTEKGLNAQEAERAWNTFLSETRRWRNDDFGTYQKRIDFTARGFVPHYKDSSLGVNDGFEHTWYEYIPASVRNSGKKVPLLFFFHGINCVPLYGAEQSGWADIADRAGMICVFPEPAIENRWNIWDDDRLPSDVSFVLALIRHMKQLYPVDPSRIYISGFSMGSTFTNALASSFPELFAAAAPCNGPHWGYLKTLDENKPAVMMFRRNSVLSTLGDSGRTVSLTRERTDRKKKEYDWKMPVIQSVGLKDPTGFDMGACFPLVNDKNNDWMSTFSFWFSYNGIDLQKLQYSSESECGLCADTSETEQERFVHQGWKNSEGQDLYHLISVRRMPHAVDLRQFEIAWKYMKRFARSENGELIERMEEL